MSTKNSELVDQNEIGRKGQTKSATASAFTKLTTKRHFFCEFVNSSMSSSPGQRIPQITKTIQNWLTQMEDIKARRSPFRKIKCNNGRQLGIPKKLRKFREHTTSTKFSNLKFLLAQIFLSQL